MKNAFIIHGFNGDTTNTFGPWLKQELEKRNYNVFMPHFPIRSEATFVGWEKVLNEYKSYITQDSIIVAHSIGNPFIIKYLAKNNLKIKLYISVAGFCDLFQVPDRPDLNNAFELFKVSNEEIEKVKLLTDKRYSLYSDNDHVIPFDILKSFIHKLNSNEVFIPGVGHMGNRDNISSLPEIIEILDIQ